MISFREVKQIKLFETLLETKREKKRRRNKQTDSTYRNMYIKLR